MHVCAYVDASYAIHEDSRSYTGVVVYVGNTLAYVSFCKQNGLTKSPTEVDLLGLLDNMSMVELFEEFVCFIMNRAPKTPKIYQDCTAALSLDTKGGGALRTKHLRARIKLA
jgi:hypothetical protein